MKIRYVLVLLLLICCGAALAQQSPQAAPPAATQVRVFTPFNSSGLVIGLAVTSKVSGSCFASSVATPQRPDAWRCNAGNAIYDPCFQNLLGDQKELACARDPFSADVVLLTLTKALPQNEHKAEPNYLKGMPWAIELANGQKCVLFTGATAPVAGMRINYGCPDGGQVVGPVDRTLPLWRVFYQTANRSLSLDQVGVVTAWY